MKKLLCVLAILISQSSFAQTNYVNGMDDVYEQMLKTHQNDSVYINKIMEAKRKWNDFIKAQVDLMYFSHNGTMAAMCINSYKTMLDIDVANETKYLFHFEDGDACSGRG